MPRHPTALDYGSYTITGTAGTFLSFGDSGSPTTVPTGAQCFVGRLETADIRMRFDATDVTATEGQLVRVGDVVYIPNSLFLETASLIRTGGVSGVIKGHFWNVEMDVLLGIS